MRTLKLKLRFTGSKKELKSLLAALGQYEREHCLSELSEVQEYAKAIETIDDSVSDKEFFGLLSRLGEAEYYDVLLHKPKISKRELPEGKLLANISVHGAYIEEFPSILTQELSEAIPDAALTATLWDCEIPGSFIRSTLKNGEFNILELDYDPRSKSFDTPFKLKYDIEEDALGIRSTLDELYGDGEDDEDDL